MDWRTYAGLAVLAMIATVSLGAAATACNGRFALRSLVLVPLWLALGIGIGDWWAARVKKSTWREQYPECHCHVCGEAMSSLVTSQVRVPWHAPDEMYIVFRPPADEPYLVPVIDDGVAEYTIETVLQTGICQPCWRRMTPQERAAAVRRAPIEYRHLAREKLLSSIEQESEAQTSFRLCPSAEEGVRKAYVLLYRERTNGR
jgi:hypothetical protein